MFGLRTLYLRFNDWIKAVHANQYIAEGVDLEKVTVVGIKPESSGTKKST